MKDTIIVEKWQSQIFEKFINSEVIGFSVKEWLFFTLSKIALRIFFFFSTIVEHNEVHHLS